ncbi:MAG: bifunctional 5,10-methylene-tetrahydrofolate dehydrogenase/5,10-methylene-tetrahydrofolate cyclohydrolase, partial [Akkermansia sp.]|nr:bifunctional 5,10-methylene-tetrahydrofolate dehydrogenase/5,10-methylene-tetrahydrofolate cyclohydrolase [Akkermansia sp.]
MSTTIINGKEVAQQIRAGLIEEIAALKAQGHTPGLAVVLVGEDPASQVYVGSKV